MIQATLVSNPQRNNLDEGRAREFLGTKLPWGESGVEFIFRLLTDFNNKQPTGFKGIFDRLSDKFNLIYAPDLRSVLDSAFSTGLVEKVDINDESGRPHEIYRVVPDSYINQLLDSLKPDPVKNLGEQPFRYDAEELEVRIDPSLLELGFAPKTLGEFLYTFNRAKSFGEMMEDPRLFPEGLSQRPIITEKFNDLLDSLLKDGFLIKKETPLGAYKLSVDYDLSKPCLELLREVENSLKEGQSSS